MTLAVMGYHFEVMTRKLSKTIGKTVELAPGAVILPENAGGE